MELPYLDPTGVAKLWAKVKNLLSTDRPAVLVLDYPKSIPQGVSPTVTAKVQPATANASVIFQAWENCKVSPDGQVIPTLEAAGTIRFYAVPTANTTLAQLVEIQVRGMENLLDQSGEAITDENGNNIEV